MPSSTTTRKPMITTTTTESNDFPSQNDVIDCGDKDFLPHEECEKVSFLIVGRVDFSIYYKHEMKGYKIKIQFIIGFLF